METPIENFLTRKKLQKNEERRAQMKHEYLDACFHADRIDESIAQVRKRLKNLVNEPEKKFQTAAHLIAKAEEKIILENGLKKLQEGKEEDLLVIHKAQQEFTPEELYGIEQEKMDKDAQMREADRRAWQEIRDDKTHPRSRQAEEQLAINRWNINILAVRRQNAEARRNGTYFHFGNDVNNVPDKTKN